MELRYEPRAPRALRRLGDRDRTAMVDGLEAFVAGRLPNADVRKLRFTPIGTDGDTLSVLAETPECVDTGRGSRRRLAPSRRYRATGSRYRKTTAPMTPGAKLKPRSAGSSKI